MYTLYGSQGSGSAAIEAALLIADAPHRIVNAATWEPGPGLEELKRVNPLGQIPTLLLPSGDVLTESAAILIYLADAHPTGGLLPRDPLRRAQAVRGLVFIVANCYAAIGVIDYPERWCHDADDAIKERIRSATKLQLYQLWDLFADTHAAAAFLTGERPGALDLLAAVVSRWSGARAHLATSRPAFHQLLLRIDAEPHVAPVMARHWPSAA